MAFVSGQQARILLGARTFSGETTKVSSGFVVDQLETTVITNTAKTFIVGQNTSTLNVDMNLDTDTTAGGQWATLTGTYKQTTPLPMSFAPSGTTALAEVWLTSSNMVSLAPATSVAGIATISLASQSTGDTDFGTVLEDLSTVTVTVNGTARDLVAASANGGVAHLHVTAYATSTSDVITIEHSTTGVGAWSTLGTFATVTGTTSERLVIAPGTTVNRYLRVVDTVTVTGSITRQISFCRR